MQYDAWKLKVSEHLRLGQAFCNDFIKQPWPELFHETDNEAADVIIRKWLQDNHYYATMPTKKKSKV